MQQGVNWGMAFSECARVLLFSWSGQAVSCIMFETMMERHKKIWPFAVFLLVKAFIAVVILDTLFEICFSGESWAQVINSTAGAVMSILGCVFFISTYEVSILKSVICMSVGEMISALGGLPGMTIVNVLEGREGLFQFYGKWMPADILIPCFWFLITAVFYYFAKPLLLKFRTYQIKHKVILGVAYFIYFLIMQIRPISNAKASNGMLLILYSPFLFLGICIIVTAFLVYRNYEKGVVTQSSFLDLQLGLMNSQYASIQKQMDRMERCQKMIDEQMKEIVAKKDAQRSSRNTDQYLENLKQEYEKISAGMYCRDWMVDAVLYCQSEAAKSQGIEVSCVIQEPSGKAWNGEKIAQLLFELFDFGIRENQKLQTNAGKQITVQISPVMNQLAVQFFTTTKRGTKPPTALLQKYGKGYGGSVTAEKQEKGIRIMAVL